MSAEIRFQSSLEHSFACFFSVLATLSVVFFVTGVARADGDLVIGSSTDLSGPVKAPATAVADGISAYFESFNNAGGWFGRKIKFVLLDDGYQPIRTLENVKKLVAQEKAFAIIGDWGTANASAVAPYIETAKVPFLFPLTGGDATRFPVKNYIFTLRSSYRQEAKAATRYAVNKLDLKKISIFYQDDSYGDAGREGVVGTLADLGLKPYGAASYSRSTSDVNPAVAKLVADKPEAIYVQANPNEALDFVKKIRAKGYTGYFIFPSIVGGFFLKEELKNEASKMIVSEVMPLATDTSIPIVAQYQKVMAAKGFSSFSSVRAQYALEGYCSAALFTAILVKAGAKATGEQLVAELQGLKGFNLKGLEVSFSPTDHQGLHQPQLFELTGGVSKPVHE